MSPRWSPRERIRLTQELSQLRGAESQSFFDAHGLGSAYRVLGEGNSKKARVTSALFAAEQRGDIDAILDAASAYLKMDPAMGSKPGLESNLSRDLPRPASPIQKALLQTVWDSFFIHRRWPTFKEIDRTFDQQYHLDIIEVARGLPLGLMAPSSLSPGISDQEIKLTIAGALACEGSAELIRLFLGAVRLATRLEADPPSETPVLTPDSLRASTDILLPTAGREETLMRLGQLLGAEHWGWSGYGWDPAKPTWTFTIGREVRQLRNVNSVESYWKIIHPPSTLATQRPFVGESSEAVVSDPGPQRIFLVHGHDQARHEVELFLQKSTPAAKVIVLSEQASRGQTIIEKFEAYGHSASFAVVLLTPDDLGRSKDASDLRPRARQNVVLELGYFLGKLGRANVAVLNKGVEEPSDINGLMYIKYPDLRWKLELARELEAAGFESDPTNT